LNLLEAARRAAPEAPFVHLSTNKVYGDAPNELELVELDTRWDYADPADANGIDETMRIDRTTHSLFGASKVAADVLVQEYGRYFGMPTVCFRAGCLTGPDHAGTQLHGFLAYLMKCTVTGEPYTVFGYGGKQVRDNLHSADLVDAFLRFHRNPRAAAVYNIGGGRGNACSMLEAIELCERIAGRGLNWEMSDRARIGDHRWWISDLDEFGSEHGGWRPQRDPETILREIYEANAERWIAAPA
ncbi:MAG TPA: NAD-dependent epimerase/dehydratase family protein, partial [Solirubrobacterales bacterium]|nr:NAD-dependent epimerase/dehydratase family protein [Solirubrobacterales bacterium]